MPDGPVRLELGVPGQIMPPAAAAVTFAQRAEADGFDAIWWPDHLMGWHPDSLWTPDLTPLAASQANPHTYFDPLVMMGAVGAQTSRLRVGVVVTDLIRRHPAVLAQTMLTLDHLTGGRAILGLGPGEQLNIRPYGLPWDKPVARLAEGIDVIRLLWRAEEPVDFEGRLFHLRRAVLGLSPFSAGPPIWTAAHGPRMLELTGRKADGWLPTKMTADQYAASLKTIEAAAAGAGRNPGAITPGMLSYVLVGPDEETVQRLTEQPLVRALCVLLPASVFRALGVEPPLEEAGSGFHDFIPTEVGREDALRIVAAIPPAVVRHYAFCGTPEQVGAARGARPVTDPVSAYLAAVNAEDWAALVGLWEPDAELVATGARPRHGREAIVAYYPKVLAGYAEHQDRPVRLIKDGSTIVVEVAFTGRTTAGRPVAFDAIDVFDLAGERIRRLSTWYDTAAVRRQVQGG